MPIDSKKKRIEIANRVKTARKNAQMTQAEVAQCIGVTPQAISNYERGINDIPNAVILKLADLFKTSADFLLGTTQEWMDNVLPFLEGAVAERAAINAMLENPDTPPYIKTYIKETLPHLFKKKQSNPWETIIKNILQPPIRDKESSKINLLFDALNDDGKRLAIDYLSVLSENEKYTQRKTETDE